MVAFSIHGRLNLCDSHKDATKIMFFSCASVKWCVYVFIAVSMSVDFFVLYSIVLQFWYLEHV